VRGGDLKSLFESGQSRPPDESGPLSPLLANIVLDPLDKELECSGGLLPS
jgi:retron-type reverse transcriptase